MATPKPATPEPLVAKLLELAQKVADAVAEAKAVEDQLIALGAGRYSHPDEPLKVCTVVAAVDASFGKPSYVLSSENEEIARKLAGESFSNLFEREVTYTPCKGFAEVVPKLLTPARAKKLAALCYVPGKPKAGQKAYIRW